MTDEDQEESTPVTTAKRRFQFCCGHRLVDHEGKCAHLHGHNYVAWITCVAPQLDGIGRVIDFSVIKDKVGAWIDASWDHKMLVNVDDTPLLEFLRTTDQPHYVMRCNPTAENMAHELRDWAQEILQPLGIDVAAVELFETENCVAEVFV